MINSKLFFNSTRKGSLGLYALILILVGLGLAVFVFTPDYKNMQSGIYAASCNDIKNKIDAAVEDYNVKNSKSFNVPGEIVNLDTLKEKGFLNDLKKCPQKGTYRFGRNGKVTCNVHPSKGE